ncbi:MAG: excinuclease ABC subunit UvrC [Betaproteobacteria bacterium]|nr:excinuclease ABC subunit UvrC [Betaproteobacteria bacterium]
MTTNERLAALREKVAKVPTHPGVYIHKSADGKVLYVGKAKNLQNRLRSYFSGLDRHAPKTRALVARIYDFEFIVVDNENESLLLENNLIKHHRPPYNILLRDDKTYPYLKVTLEDAWPRVFQTRKRRNDGGIYFGPYSNAAELQSTLSVIQRFFPLVKCTPNVFKTVTRPCNYFHIKKCLAPCKLEVDQGHYKDLVERVVALLSGKTAELVAKIKLDMNSAAQVMNFEKAALLRDQLRALEKLSQQQSVTLLPGFDADIVDFAWSSQSVSVYFAIVRDGKLVGANAHLIRDGLEKLSELQFESEDPQSQEIFSQAEFIHQVVGQFYAQHEIPPSLFFPSAMQYLNAARVESLNALLNALEQDKSKRQNLAPQKIQIFVGAKPAEIKTLKGTQKKMFIDAFDGLCAMVLENARGKLKDSLSSDESVQKRVTALQQFLGLAQLPTWIECYDISTFQGGSTVASGVVFRDGRPAKKDYRKYIIRDVVGQDDFASLREVIRRRFKNDRRFEVPDVLLIDGGEPQVREVAWLLKSLGLDSVPLYGIAKSRTERNFRSQKVTASSERIVIPKRNEAGELLPDMVPETRFLTSAAPEFQLVTQIRNEAHRFAISFHRKTRDKKSLRSILNEVPGLGPKRRKKLLLEFGSVEGIIKASEDELVRRGEVPRSVAAAVVEFFAQSKKEQTE